MDANNTLSVAECWRLLEAQLMGRLATATDRGPRIWPINYRVREMILGRAPSVTN